MRKPSAIRNVAIIAHVDHGKTTLVDGLLKQSKTFRDNQAEMGQSMILDTGDLERERGITISAKTASVEYEGHKINIIDTPGHADFSGEVERTLGMADGVLLIVDAQEGPMPQTRFVLAKALALGLTPIVVINKIDKRDARVAETERETGDLFLDLAVKDEQLEFPTYYAVGREGKAWKELPEDLEAGAASADADSGAAADLTPIFQAIIEQIPAPGGSTDEPLQMLVTALDWDSYQGKYAVGRIVRGTVKPGLAVARLDRDGQQSKEKIDKVFISKGLDREETPAAGAGEIVQLTGLPDVRIGETIAAPEQPDALPVMEIESPTLQIAVGPNTSPFAGREGKYTTSRQIGDRLRQELETNVSLRVEEQGTTFLVSGRGELHLSVLVETMRREGYELEIGRPQVVTKEEDGKTVEPVEELIVEVPEEYVGAVTSELGKRKAELKHMHPGGQSGKGVTQLTYRLPTRALLGLRNVLLTATKGTAVMNSLLIGYEPVGPAIRQLRNGVLISATTGETVIYSLKVVEERGTAFVGPGTKVYEGMIIGLNRRDDDMEINACKEKKLTNVRAASTDMTTQLTPFTRLSLEEALDFIEKDELLEVTPQSLRMRKRGLTMLERKRAAKT
ncbi:MAG: translational GTPase TypA [bacterium]|nr:translational GTPase TypA [bacterium]MDZ4247886.1 translational GTPase TypA [Patescibacteria group bacterium]